MGPHTLSKVAARMPNPKNSPTPMAKRIINAGIDAIAHFTINTTIEENRI
jgi:hypothetical protein